MKRTITTVLLFSAMFWASCEKYLETPPDQRAVLDSPEKVSELLTAAYPRANYMTFTEAMSDNAGDKGPAAGGGIYVNQDPWNFVDVRDRYQDSPDYYWYACYKAISVANRALAVIETRPDGHLYSAQRGEALLARAYAHFMLVTLFAKAYDPVTADADPGIPYVTDPEETVLIKYERKTVAHVYGQIEKDIAAGLPLIDDSKYNVPKYHFTRAAAHAFASRFYLFKRNYAAVVSHATAVVDGGDFAGYLRPVNSVQYRSMEYYAKQADYTIATNRSNLLLVEAVSLWGGSFANYRYGLTSELLSELYFTRNVTGGQYAYMIYGGHELVYNTPKFRIHFVRSGINANYGTPYNMIPLFSVEEVLLNRAEAYAMVGMVDEAIADLNVFASKKVFASQNNPVYDPVLHRINVAKLVNFYQQADLGRCLVLAVLDFKRREYLFEGLRYLDILRHNLPVVHTTKDRTVTHVLGPNDPRRVLQLPQEVVMSGMQPNPR